MPLALFAEDEPLINQPEDNSPRTAPTNRAYVENFFKEYKASIEAKDVDRFLACYSKGFSKDMIDYENGFTNQWYLTYLDIEEGLKEDNFSVYQGKTVKITYKLYDIKLNLLQAVVKLDLITDVSGKIDKREEKFTLEWDEEEQKWLLLSF